MLYMLGPIRFEIAPFNLTETTFSHGASFSEKPVVGQRPPLEWTGDGAQTWSLRANLFPERFGGEGNLLALRTMRLLGQPQYMLRGDGLPIGWVVIDSVTERASYLDRRGRGRVVEVDITLRRSSAPNAGAFFGALKSAFSGLFR